MDVLDHPEAIAIPHGKTGLRSYDGAEFRGGDAPIVTNAFAASSMSALM